MRGSVRILGNAFSLSWGKPHLKNKGREGEISRTDGPLGNNTHHSQREHVLGQFVRRWHWDNLNKSRS